MHEPRLRTRDYRRTALAPRHRRMMRALAEAYFAHDDGPTPERLDDFVEDVDHFIAPASKTLRAGLRFTLDLLHFLPPLVVRRFATFESLTRDERSHMLDAMERSRFAIFTLVFIAWKTILSMLFFEHEDELRAMGYPGPERQRYKRGLALVAATEQVETA
jgi:hypothetical protein